MNPSELLDLIDAGQPSWADDALCKEHPEIQFVPTNERPPRTAAMQICGRCLCRVECLAYALADPDLIGIWGGTDSAARRAMRRANTPTPKETRPCPDAPEPPTDQHEPTAGTGGTPTCAPPRAPADSSTHGRGAPR